MSYDISLCDPVTHETLEVDDTHFVAGGTRTIGGTKELWLNVTYNYGKHFRRDDVLGSKGIRSIYGKTGAESIPMLEKAISALGDDVDDSDYWNATEGKPKNTLPIRDTWNQKQSDLLTTSQQTDGRLVNRL